MNIVNGDCLAGQLKEASVGGETIICREALVSGPLQADNLVDFFDMRADFISKEYPAEKDDYFKKVVSEFDKILAIPENSEVNLWFEDDLFCQVNMWFCLYLIPKNQNLKIYRVFPNTMKENNWRGFSDSEISDLEKSLQSRVLFDEADIELGINLWKAYQNNDKETLKQLSEKQSDCYRYLQEVINSYVSINPEVFIANLMENGISDFDLVFEKFRDELGIFGFGDLQIKNIFNKVLKEKEK